MNTFRLRIILPSLLLLLSGAMAGSQPGQVIWWGANPWGGATGTATSGLVCGLVMVGGQILSNVVAVAGGGGQALALKSDGTVVCGGGGRGGVPAGLTNIVAISTSGSVSLALKRDGSVIVWGDDSQSLPSAPADLASVVAVSAGAGHCLALTRDGTVVGWGNPWRKPGLVRGVPPGLSNVVAIAATRSHYGHDLALRSDGTVVEWSLRGSIQVGPLGPTVTNKVGEIGELVQIAELHVIEGLSNVLAVAAGEDFGMFGGKWVNLALKSDGTVFGWGENGEGAGVLIMRLGTLSSLPLEFGHSPD
jgi:hypothetical protein